MRAHNTAGLPVVARVNKISDTRVDLSSLIAQYLNALDTTKGHF